MPVATSLYDLPLHRITGEPASLGEFRGKVLLIVNVASRCGLTPQYDGLERLYRSYKSKGLEILGFPANDFGSQEPGTNQEIQKFCTTSYDVSFPMFEKIAVTGTGTHPLYRFLTEAQPAAQVNEPGFRSGLDSFLTGIGAPLTGPEPGILWNFEKFLIGRDGSVLARFAPDMLPDDPRVVKAIEAAL